MKKSHVLFGISPFNSKFNEFYLTRMLKWGFENYECVDVLHPYEEAKYLLMGCGDDVNKARKKSRKEFYRTERAVNCFLKNNESSLYCDKVLKFSDFYNIAIYDYLYEKVNYLFNNDELFCSICKEQSYKAILQRKNATFSKNTIDEDKLNVATNYILRELPFIIAPSTLIKTNDIIHVSYYCTWPIVEYIYSGNILLNPYSKTKIIIKDHG
ncbi:tRNA-dependent cyclodipeptide synthase [Pseudochrobactrum asaccharolyticum]|uniref:Cyclodipeptide synthase n=1 Tax=Pseudochrobactrum asaccharolyticum TaxID=354351 RepID=A0A366DMH0_9HYPH|nr:tRNA-dependent cyclodipeptide synthase [Pseudochrobactrum asaccharolyticum]RBO91145.1 cyclo(L-leucyl-L-leucyl) synthase [Pseudochrobactrum asaccharolyticum]